MLLLVCARLARQPLDTLAFPRRGWNSLTVGVGALDGAVTLAQGCTDRNLCSCLSTLEHQRSCAAYPEALASGVHLNAYLQTQDACDESRRATVHMSRLISALGDERPLESCRSGHPWD